ncbi:Cu(I)-responsive transcriptional regulator [Vibrio sp. SM6]|uniref:HTH-type transcriptional regulator CueR n=1 Tax=Vibrio agarilyticus TaxID=2726741 RepID=A0A7X8TQ51_9VIBR|nr:Cu(I)-responsive transcriptional regulator [Vibrio agarilyticus]NLS12178.1 Cu(I)-responsive transcriptional regulator [Vibrio agarilyticus]
MNIGEIAKRTGLSSKAIRMYEEKGLITAPSRSEGDYRVYGDVQLQELNLIARAKLAGFSLLECGEFVQLARDPNRKSAEVKAHAQDKLNEVNQKIAALTQIKHQLEQWVSRCPGDEGSGCPIIDDLTRTDVTST